MNPLIVYTTKYGCIQKCVELSKKAIHYEAKILNAKQKLFKLDNFDTIVIDGPVYMGNMHKKISQFCQYNKVLLLQKCLILFACCYIPKETEGRGFLSHNLLQHASYITTVGGEMNYQKTDFAGRMLFTQLKKIDRFKQGFAEPSINMEEIKSNVHYVEKRLWL